jgi:hypothetical protein
VGVDQVWCRTVDLDEWSKYVSERGKGKGAKERKNEVKAGESHSEDEH